MRISDWSSDVCSSDLWTTSIGVGASIVTATPESRSPMSHHAVAGPPATPPSPQHPLPHAIDYQPRSEEHTSELQSLMRISYAVFCLKKNNHDIQQLTSHTVYYQYDWLTLDCFL